MAWQRDSHLSSGAASTIQVDGRVFTGWCVVISSGDATGIPSMSGWRRLSSDPEKGPRIYPRSDPENRLLVCAGAFGENLDENLIKCL